LRIRLGGGFGAKQALEARASEMDTNELFAVRLRLSDVHDAAARGEIGFHAARDVVRKWNADFEVGADGDVEARQKSGAAAAKIFAGGFFLEDDAAGVAAANIHG